MFLNRVRELGYLACRHHPLSSFGVVPSPDGKDEWVRCADCGKAMLSVRRLLCEQASPSESPTLARAYAEWTGRVDVPCRISTMPLRNRVLPRVILSKLNTLHRGYRLLRAVNSPFVRDVENGDLDDGSGRRRRRNPEAADPRLFRNLMKEYLTLIDRVSVESEKDPAATTSNNDALTVKAILTNMKNAFADVDVHEQYFEVLAPYAKRVGRHYASNVPRGGGGREGTEENAERTTSKERREDRDDHEEEEEEEEEKDDDGTLWVESNGSGSGKEEKDVPFGSALERELERSAVIHERYSRYCIPFDIVHVIVLCYVCGEDTETTYNLVLDMASKICTGFFSFPASHVFPVGNQIRRFLDRHVTPSSNLKSYYLLRALRRGGKELAEKFDEQFLRTYGILEAEIKKRVPMAGEDLSKKDRFVYQQVFPYLFFEDGEQDDDDDDDRSGLSGDRTNDSSYYAFVMALAHYVSKSQAIRCTSSGFPSIRKSRASSGGGGGVGRKDTVPKGVLAECKKIHRFVRNCMKRVRVFDHGKATRRTETDAPVPQEQTMYWTKDMFNLFLTANADLGKDLAEIIVFMS